MIEAWISAHSDYILLRKRGSTLILSLKRKKIIFDCAGSLLLCRLFCPCGKQGLLAVVVGGLLCYGVYCCGEQALGYSGFRRCGFQALEHRFDSFGTWVSCSTTRRIRDWTCVSCIGRWILNHGPQGSPTLVLSTAIIILNKFHITLVSPASSILGEWGNTSSYLILTSLEQSSLNTSIPTHVSFPQQP